METDLNVTMEHEDMSSDFFDFVSLNIKTQNMTNCQHVGSVIAFDGYVIKVSSLPCLVGSLCCIENEIGNSVTGEVVRIGEKFVDIVPHDSSFAIAFGDKVILLEVAQKVSVGSELLGRVIDGLGQPLDHLGEIKINEKLNLMVPQYILFTVLQFLMY